MKNIITLEQLSEIDMDLGKGVRVAFCESVKDSYEIVRIWDFDSFNAIKKGLYNRQNYKVFRIDSLNDLICVYVLHQKN